MIFPSIASHANKHGIIPLKKYGQNFIFDSTLCDKIVKVSGVKENSIILEIGPGVAGLTRSILACNPKSLTIIETDFRCIPLLEEIRSIYSNLNIIQGDALKYDLSNLNYQNSTILPSPYMAKSTEYLDCQSIVSSNIYKTFNVDRVYKLPAEIELQNKSKIDIISNLPYQIGTKLIIRWLKQAYLINNITVMLQKEVVDRICAKVGTKCYGRLSIICQLICLVKKCFNVRPQAFYPAPQVHSAIVKLLPLNVVLQPEIINIVELITKFAFGERRKMIKSSLRKLTPQIEDFLQELKIDNSYRAENLSPQDYLSLAKLIFSFMSHSYNKTA